MKIGLVKWTWRAGKGTDNKTTKRLVRDEAAAEDSDGEPRDLADTPKYSYRNSFDCQ